jgi:hypothetical protein
LDYKFFCFKRCPYQRFISGILFCGINISNLKKFILDREKFKDGNFFQVSQYAHIFVSQYQYIKNIPNLTILNFENINNDLCKYLISAGIEIKHNENNIKKNTSLKEKSFWEYYDKFVLDFVNEYFDEDFKNFNFPKYTSLIDFYYQMNKKYNSFNF